MKGLKLLALFVSVSAFLQLLTPPLTKADYFPQFTFKMENSENGRKEYARKLQARIKKIYNGIPTPSPKETEWILNELKRYYATNNYKIYERLAETKEFSFYKAKGFFKEISNSLTAIIKSSSPEAEMLGWVVLIESLLESWGDSWNYVYDLYTKGYIDKKLITSSFFESTETKEFASLSITFANNCEIVSIQILSKIIRPYFEKKVATK